MHATPDGSKESRHAALNRLKEAGGDPHELELPELNYGEHLMTWLFEIGPGNNGVAMTWHDMSAWATMTGTIVSPWESLALRHLAVAYMGELMSAKDPKRGAPHDARITMRDEVNNNLKMALRSLAVKR